MLLDILLKDRMQIDRADTEAVMDLIKASVGHFKQAPIYGISAIRALHSEEVADYMQALRIQANALKIPLASFEYENKIWKITLTK